METKTLESEAGRYAQIYADVYCAVTNNLRGKVITDNNEGYPVGLNKGEVDQAADRAATWFAGRMTDRRLAGQGLDELNGAFDQEGNA